MPTLAYHGDALAMNGAGADGAPLQRFEFMTSVGWQAGRFIAMLRDVSNAHVLGAASIVVGRCSWRRAHGDSLIFGGRSPYYRISPAVDCPPCRRARGG